MRLLRPIPDRHKLIFILFLVLAAGFLASSLASYFVSKMSIRNSIVANELPLTSDNIYSEIQKDLIRPILISSTMAQDTFVRDWVLAGESDETRIVRFLQTVKTQYGAFTSFLVSENSRRYYHADAGVLKSVKEDEPRDAWYFRTRQLHEAYEINVDPDLANRDKLTIFINYRVLDYDGKFIGATGIGLTVDAVGRLLNDYHTRYGRNIYFLDASGKVVLDNDAQGGGNIREREGIAAIADQVLTSQNASFLYQRQGRTHLLNVRYVPELKWYLCVEKVEDEALGSIRHTLFLNLVIFVIVTTLILLLVWPTVNHFQKRLEEMATTDILTGLYNRRAFDMHLNQGLEEFRRYRQPLSGILIDIDHFKRINDEEGHLAGDEVLRGVAALLKDAVRQMDIACRWGGEEFFVLLKNADEAAATVVAEKLRQAVEDARFSYRDKLLSVTISIGVASCLTEEEDGDHLMTQADAALYRAKNGGRNQVRRASEAG